MKSMFPTPKPCSSRGLGALLLVFAAWLVPASASYGIADTSCCITLPPSPPPPNLSIQVQADAVVDGSLGAPPGTGIEPDFSLFNVFILPGDSVSPTPAIPAGRYTAWCFDRTTRIDAFNPTAFGGSLHSSCDPNLNQYLPNHPGVKKGPEVWNKVNYLLNHRAEGCGGLVPTMWEFQTAIFQLFDQGLPPTGGGNPPYRQEVVDCLVDKANANGPSWTPTCGDKMAVVFNIDINWDNLAPEVQLLFLEVPCPCTSLGDYVWLDDNANGIQDEPASNGVNGVTVNLLDCDGNPVVDGASQPVTTTTANDVDGNPGYYLFNNLLPGCYQVEFELPAGHGFTTQNAPGSTGANGSDAHPVTGRTGDIPIAFGDHDLNWDAGLIRPASIGDFVWEDGDLDGQQGGTEPGIAGATVSLSDCSGAAVTDIFGNPVGPVVTGADGAYSFTNLKPGNYQVTFVLPGGYVFTQAFAGGTSTDSNANPADGVSDCRTLVSGQNDDTVDAGAYKPASIGDFVWEDGDLDGQQGGTEPGIAGATVSLSDCSGAAVTDIFGNPVGPVVTGADGAYSFTNLKPGNYQVTFVLPGGYVFTQAFAGGTSTDSNANPADGESDCRTLVSGQNDDTVDAGAYKPASIGDFVWEDGDLDGQQGGTEPGIAGATVSLSDCSGAAVTDIFGNPVGPVVTGADGAYSFTNLKPGNYQVTFVLPGGYVFTQAFAGGTSTDSNANPADGESDCRTLVSGQNDDTVDAGAYKPASIGDFVWEDTDKNGQQDGGEPGISGATVSLSDCSGVAVTDINGNPVTPVVTGANGAYSFTNLKPGQYQVTFVLPSGYTFTQAFNGPTDTDSNANQADGKSDCRTLASGQNDDTVDAGGTKPDETGECVPATFVFDGNSPGDGTDGNVRTFTVDGVSVKATAFSRDTDGNWSPAYLGQYPGGLGVTDSSEGNGSGNLHTVDNVGQINYVLFEFSKPVVVSQAFLGYVVDDSDLTVWLGEFADPFNNHMTLSDALLESFAYTEDNTTTSSSPRWASFNSGEVVANAVVIAAWPGDETPEDRFKIQKLDVCVPGSQALATIGNRVWEDENQNGTQDTSEFGVAGVTVQLYRCVGDSLVGTTTSSSQGLYSFTVPPGDYYVKFSNLPSGYVFSPSTPSGVSDATDSDADQITGKTACTTLVDGEDDDSWDAGIYKPVVTACIPATFNFNGSSSGSGTAGNIRTFSAGGVSVKASAFSRTKSGGSWAAAYLGTFSGGLGVTDSGEGSGGGNSHTVDNIDRDNYVLFEFSKPVVVSRAFLGYVVSDSDITVWVGNASNPYVNHLNLNDGVLAGLGYTEDNTTTSTTTRWATFNGGEIVGNVLVIAAWPGDTTPEDQFKIQKLEVCEPSGQACFGSISGSVMRDCNDDGSLSGEAGLGGVTVQLKDNSWALLDSTTTGSDGSYSFTGLAAATYRVVVVPPSGHDLSVDPDSTADGKATINLASCQDKTGVKFGYHGTAPAVSLVKTGPTSALCGSTITFRYEVKNTGNTCLYGGMSVSDPLFGGQIWHKTPVTPGESYVFEKTYVVKANDPNPLVSTATVYGHPPGNLPVVSKQSTWSVELQGCAPACPVVIAGDEKCTIQWNACSGATKYKIKRSLSPNGTYTVVKNDCTSTSWSNTGLSNGTQYYYKVCAVVGGSDSADSPEACGIPTSGLPSPWKSKDIGSVGADGGASYDGGTFTVNGSGDDIWNASDAFRFVYQSASGNCTVIAKVTGVQNTHGWAKAGVMIRDSLSPDAEHASVFITPSNGVAFQYRSNTGGSSSNENTTGVDAPHWVKIVRSGATFIAYQSSNGSSWTKIGSKSISMSSSVYIGLATTSHNDGVVSTATFKNITASP